jgi:hypothetical protein
MLSINAQRRLLRVVLFPLILFLAILRALLSMSTRARIARLRANAATLDLPSLDPQSLEVRSAGSSL